MTADEVAELFEVTQQCLRNWHKKGILNRLSIRRRTYYKKEDVLNFINQ